MATTAVPSSQNAATVRRRRADRRTTTGAPSAVVSGVAAGEAPGITAPYFQQGQSARLRRSSPAWTDPRRRAWSCFQRLGACLGDGGQGGVGKDHKGRNMASWATSLRHSLSASNVASSYVGGHWLQRPTLRSAPLASRVPQTRHFAGTPALPAWRRCPAGWSGDGDRGRRPSRKREGRRWARPPGVRARDQDRARCWRARVMPT